jgi:hypothetical protein
VIVSWLIALLRGAAALGSLLFLVAAASLILAGGIEMVTGRNAPGWLGGRFFYRRGWASEPHWTSVRWRKNGFFVLGFGFGSIIVSMTLYLVAIGRLP